MACCGSSFKTTTYLAGGLALVQSCTSLGLSIFFLIIFYGNGEEIVSRNSWNTLQRVTQGSEEVRNGLTITATVYNSIWLLASLLLIGANLSKRYHIIQFWVILTAFIPFCDLVTTVVYLLSAWPTDRENIANSTEQTTTTGQDATTGQEVTTETLSTTEFLSSTVDYAYTDDYTFYILHVLTFSRLLPITLIINGMCCYYAQKRIFQILKQNKAKRDVVSKGETGPKDAKRNGTISEEIELERRGEISRQSRNRSNRKGRHDQIPNRNENPRNRVHDMYGDNQAPYNRETSTPENRYPYNEEGNHGHNQAPYNREDARPEYRYKEDGNQRQNRKPHVREDNRRENPRRDRKGEEIFKDDFEAMELSMKKLPRVSQVHGRSLHQDHQSEPVHRRDQVANIYPEQPSHPEPKPVEHARKDQMFVPTPFVVPPVDYDPDDSDEGYPSYDNRALNMSDETRQPSKLRRTGSGYPDHLSRQSSARSNLSQPARRDYPQGNRDHYPPPTDRRSPYPQDRQRNDRPRVAQLAAQVERSNSNRSQLGPPGLRRENSNRSRTGPPRSPAPNRDWRFDARQGRGAQDVKRIEEWPSDGEEDDSRKRNNVRYESEPGYDYRKAGGRGHEGLSRF